MRNAPMRQINRHPLVSVFADLVSKCQISPHSINTFLVGTHSPETAVGGTSQESTQATCTHFMETVEGETSQDMGRKKLRRALTSWRSKGGTSLDMERK